MQVTVQRGWGAACSPFKYWWLMTRSSFVSREGVLFQCSQMWGFPSPVLSQELHKERSNRVPPFVILSSEMNWRGPVQFISSSVLCGNIQGTQLCSWVGERCVLILVYRDLKSACVILSLCALDILLRSTMQSVCNRIGKTCLCKWHVPWNRQLGLCVGRTAGVSGWTMDRDAYLFFHHCNFVSEELPGAFREFSLLQRRSRWTFLRLLILPVLVCFSVRFSGVSLLQNILREFHFKDSCFLHTEIYGWQKLYKTFRTFLNIKMLKTITNRMNLGKICF